MMWQRPCTVLFLATLLGGAPSCSKPEDKPAAPATKSEADGAGSAGAGSAAAAPPPPPVRPAVEPVKPSMDIKAAPADAVKLPSGMLYKKLSEVPGGAQPTRNDTVVLHLTGWKTESGDTFITTKTRGNPTSLDLSKAEAFYGEVFTQVRKGEKVMMWMPAELVGKSGKGKAEGLAFEAELVDIQAAPVVPPDVAGPPATAKTTKGGLRYTVVAPGTGKAKARFFDTASFRYTIWDSTGKMLSSTAARSRPVSSALYKQPLPLEDIMTTMVAGQRNRFWVDAAKMEQVSTEHAKGLLCYELQLMEITEGKQPPPTPRDVKAPPAGALKTPLGVSYRVLSPGKGTAKPAATDTVKVNYTGWTTDGRMFDSSVVRGEPTSFPLNGVIKGWTDGIPQMKVGETVRFWIPEELAYKGQPNNPQGMLVFDVELLEILPPPSASPGSPHGGMPPGGAHGMPPGGHSADDGHGH
jgi:FKBP-type peptidyl-prolyl cis-trans isomerase